MGTIFSCFAARKGNVRRLIQRQGRELEIFVLTSALFLIIVLENKHDKGLFILITEPHLLVARRRGVCLPIRP